MYPKDYNVPSHMCSSETKGSNFVVQFSLKRVKTGSQMKTTWTPDGTNETETVMC